jgi:hypothetical protein
MSLRKAKVLRSFMRDTPTKKTENGAHIIDELKHHTAEFPTPIPDPADLNTANEDLKQKTIAAINGGAEAIRARDESEKAWDTIFSKCCDYVDGVADGNVLIITQAGMKSTATEIHAKTAPNQPLIIDAKGDHTIKGKIDVECMALPDADIFICMASTSPISASITMSQLKPSADMVMVFSTKRKMALEGLESRKEYFIAVVGYNSAGLGAMSSSVSVMSL